MKPKKSFLHYQSWEDDLVCSSNSSGAGAVTHKSHSTWRGPLGDPGFAMKIHQESSGQTFVQQSWGKPLQSFPVLVLPNDKCLFHVRIKQCRRQSHKQKLQWHWFCMLAESLLKRNSHTCQSFSTWKLRLWYSLSSHIQANRNTFIQPFWQWHVDTSITW